LKPVMSFVWMRFNSCWVTRQSNAVKLVWDLGLNECNHLPRPTVCGAATHATVAWSFRRLDEALVVPHSAGSVFISHHPVVYGAGRAWWQSSG
jgi:hypothetical protein